MSIQMEKFIKLFETVGVSIKDTLWQANKYYIDKK